MLALAPVVGDQLRHGIGVVTGRAVREVENRNHHLRGRLGWAEAATNHLAVDKKVQSLRHPVHGVGMEFGHIDGQAYGLEVLDDREAAERVQTQADSSR